MSDLQSFDELAAKRQDVELCNPVIYFLFDGDELVYIGQTVTLNTRLGQHALRFKFTSYSIEQSVLTKHKREKREREYIENFKPRHNIAYTGKECRKDDIPATIRKMHTLSMHRGPVRRCLKCLEIRNQVQKLSDGDLNFVSELKCR